MQIKRSVGGMRLERRRRGEGSGGNEGRDGKRRKQQAIMGEVISGVYIPLLCPGVWASKE